MFKCITKYRLYKQIEPLNSTGLPKLTPGYGTNFTPCSSVSIVKFMHVNADWVYC